jgi:hypothetical protein
MIENKRGFALHEIIFAMAFSFFMMGATLGMFYNGDMLSEICYVLSGVLVIAGILFVLLIVKAEEVKKENKPNEMTPSSWGLVVLMLVFFGVMIVAIAYVGDRQLNPTEEFCYNIGAGTQQGATLNRAVVLETKQCIKNETGFHANGKAIFK